MHEWIILFLVASYCLDCGHLEKDDATAGHSIYFSCRFVRTGR